MQTHVGSQLLPARVSPVIVKLTPPSLASLPRRYGSGQLRPGDSVLLYDTAGRLLQTTKLRQKYSDTLLELEGNVTGLNISVLEFPDIGCGGWEIRNSYFHDAYQRVFVQSGPGRFVNNTLMRVGASVSVRSTQASGNEGGVPREIFISGNRFTNVSMTPKSLQPFSVASSAIEVGKQQELVSASYNNITIRSNHISNTADSAIAMFTSGNVIIIGNTFFSPVVSDVLAGHPSPNQRQAVFVQTSVGIVVDGNHLSDPSNACVLDNSTHSLVLGLGSGTSDVTLDGARMPPT